MKSEKDHVERRSWSKLANRLSRSSMVCKKISGIGLNAWRTVISCVSEFVFLDVIHKRQNWTRFPVGSSQRLEKLVFTVSVLDVQLLEGQCVGSTVCGRQVGRWQLDSKTERFLRCLLAKATWCMKCNYSYIRFKN